MNVTTWTVRLFGGRNIGVTYDGVMLTALNQSISVSTLAQSLQSELAEAAKTTPVQNISPFGGCNMGRAVGNVLDNQPAWRNAVQAALATYVAQQTSNGNFADADSWRW